MKFKLIYFGDIFVNPKKRAQHIADIRMQFHPQLKKLVEHSPWDNLTRYMLPNASKAPLITRHVGGIDWNPIISPNLKMIAELDILMLHPEIVGVARSDIDNRIKTLMDGLRCPQNEHEDDDHLVTKLTVNTSHLLSHDMFPCNIKPSPDAIFMLIDVNVRVTEGTLENLPFMV